MPPFFAWRVLVVCNPRFYPNLSGPSRSSLLDLVEWCSSRITSTRHGRRSSSDDSRRCCRLDHGFAGLREVHARALGARGLSQVRSCVLLDGDDVRTALEAHSYEPEARDAFYHALASLAVLLAKQGHAVLVAATPKARVSRARACRAAVLRGLDTRGAARVVRGSRHETSLRSREHRPDHDAAWRGHRVRGTARAGHHGRWRPRRNRRTGRSSSRLR